MKRMIWITLLLLPFAVTFAGETAEEPTCTTEPVVLSQLSDEDLKQWEHESNATVTRVGGGGFPQCPTDPRRCANAMGGCSPTSNCSSVNTGLTACETSDGATIECKYGQTVHTRSCECDAPMTPCYGSEVRLVCQ